MVTDFVICSLQACGWIFLLSITLVALLVRGIRPCFTQAVFLKSKYWSHYIDTERRLFDETCKEHAKSFAKLCVQQYFGSVSGEMVVLHRQHSQTDGKEKRDGEEKHASEDEKLYGIREKEDMNKVLWNWHTCKPPLRLQTQEKDQSMSEHTSQAQDHGSLSEVHKKCK